MARNVVPGEIDPDDLPTLAQSQLVESMNQPLRVECRAIETILKDEEKNNLIAEHSLGKLVAKLQNEATYGSRAILKVAAVCGVDPSRLYRAAQFYEIFTDRKQIEKLMARRGDGGYRFSWSHVLAIIPVEGVDRRAEVIEVAFRDRLTAKDLYRYILGHHDNRKGRMLRTVMLPRTLSSGLERLTLMTTKLRAQFQITLPQSVLQPLTGLTPEQLNGDVLERVARVREEMTGLAKEAAEGAAEIAKLEEELSRRAGTSEKSANQPAKSIAQEAKTSHRLTVRPRRSRRPVGA